MGAPDVSTPLQARLAGLLGADHPYFTERDTLRDLFDRFVAQFPYAPFGSYNLPFLEECETGRAVLAQTPAQRQALVILVIERIGDLVRTLGDEDADDQINRCLSMFYHHVLLLPDEREVYLVALVEVQIANITPVSCYTIANIFWVLLLRSIRQGLSDELRQVVKSLALAAADVPHINPGGINVNDDGDVVSYLIDEAPSPDQVVAIPAEVVADLSAFFAEAAASEEYRNYYAKKPKKLESGRRILSLPASERGRFVLPLLRQLLASRWCHSSGLPRNPDVISLLRPLLRCSSPQDPQEWEACIDYMVRLRGWDRAPNADFLTTLERWHKETPMAEEVKQALRRWRDVVKDHWTTQRQRGLVERMDRLIDGVRDEPAVEKGPWGRQAKAWLRSLPDGDQESWRALLLQARTAGETPKPSATWFKEAAKTIDLVGREAFQAQVTDWLEDFPLNPAKPDRNTNLMKGLIWGLGAGSGGEAAYPLGAFARRAFAKVPGYGPGSVKLGNAAMLSLGRLGGTEGIAQLTGLKARTRYPSVRRHVDQILEEVAARVGIGAEEIEELGVPILGLNSDGRRLVPVDDFQAELAITGSESAELRWITPADKRQKSVPVAVKRDHEAALKDLKHDLKELRDTLRIQRLRVETLMVAERTWTYGTWCERYGAHPLLSSLCRRLIWRFETDGRAQSAMPGEEAVLTAAGEALKVDDEATTVSLWHPIDATVAEVRAWRARLRELEITQPFKQAHREIYILTEAERQTETYSNRFAGHVIRQHQFRALCQQRDWHYELQGSWDSHNTPTRALPDLGLVARFVVDAPDYDREHPERWSEEGATGFPFLTSDRVQFTDLGLEPIALETVPPRLFSELMRDVDLFVSLTSVGNNPEWHDGGPGGQFGAYWRSYAFGELGAFAETRREVLAELLPKLKIADRLELGERYLVVRGQLRTYKIHLRSANILMEPNDQYLCIVVGRAEPKVGPSLRLPFEGDPVISLILSKAFLLAADDKIKDPGIVSQIQT